MTDKPEADPTRRTSAMNKAMGDDNCPKCGKRKPGTGHGWKPCCVCPIEPAPAKAPSAPLGDAAEAVKELRAGADMALAGQLRDRQIAAADTIEALQADNARLVKRLEFSESARDGFDDWQKETAAENAALQARLDRMVKAASVFVQPVRVVSIDNKGVKTIHVEVFATELDALIAALPDSADVKT